MQKILISGFVLSVLLILTGCLGNRNNPSTMFKDNKIEKSLDGINKFNVGGISEVEFIKSDSNYLEISVINVNLENILITTNKNQISILYPKNNKGDEKISLKIFTKNILAINGEAIGAILIPDIINSTNGRIVLKSVASVNLTMDVESINCDLSSIAQLILKGSSKVGEINITSVANLQISEFNRGKTIIRATAVALLN
jgi:hypothetical protein